MKLLKTRSWFILGILVMLLGALIFLWYRGELSSFNEGSKVNLLILGLDEVEGTSRSDTILAARIQKSKLDAIFIPRDIRVKFPNGQITKINSSYQLGKVNLTREIVSGFLDLPLRYYIIIDYQGFENIIDILGGVTIRVEKDLDYEDKSQNLHIHIPKGVQHLSGKEALDYARFRGKLGDLGRIKRQQKLIRALLDKGIQFKGWEKLKNLIKTTYQYIETNLSLIDMYGLARLCEGITSDQVGIEQIPGTSVVIEEVSYLEPNIVRTRELVSELMKGRDILTYSDVKVSVLNGNGVYRMAHRVGEYLKQRGFNIVHIGDAETYNYQENFVLDLCGEEKKLAMLKQALDAEFQVVKREEFTDHLEKIRKITGYSPTSEDFVFVFGKGFDIG